jgi:hypothetical protein
VHDTRITYDWNGHTIDFSAWADDDYGIYEYESRDGYDFTFDLQPVAGEVRIYILKQPSYRGQSESGHSTHRLGLESAHPYVCVEAYLAPTNVPDALSWMVYWAEETATYIRTGCAFS